VSFYHPFGVTPEDVGYDYGTVLTTTLPSMVLLIVASRLAGAVVVGVVYWQYRRWASDTFLTREDRPRARDVAALLWLSRGLLYLFVLVPLYVIIALVLSRAAG
jgi:hypothetical protein